MCRGSKKGEGEGGMAMGRGMEEFIMGCLSKGMKGFRFHLSTANSLGAVQASMH